MVLGVGRIPYKLLTKPLLGAIDLMYFFHGRGGVMDG